MDGTNKELKVRILADVEQYKKGMAESAESTDKFRQSVQQSTNRLNTSLETTKAKAEGVERSFRLLDRMPFSFGVNASRAADRLGNSMSNLQTRVTGANGVAIEFSRIIQDAPFGIIGVGNNLTQLTQNFASLQQQTGSTASALQIAFRSLLSGSNLLVLGISALTTAFTVYAMRSRGAKEETDELTLSYRNLKEAMDDIRRSQEPTTEQQNRFIDSLSNLEKTMLKATQSGRAETTQLKTLYAATQDTTLSMEARVRAAEELKRQYPSYFDKISEEKILTGEAKEAYDLLTGSLIATAKARIYNSQISDNASKELANLAEIAKLEAQIAEDRLKQQEYNDAMLAGGTVSGGAQLQLTENIANAQFRINALKEQNNKLIEDSIKLEKEVKKSIEEGSLGLADIPKERMKAQKDYERLVIDSENRIRLLQLEGRALDLEQVNIYYDEQIRRAEGNTQIILRLEENRQREIQAVNERWNKIRLDTILKFEREKWTAIIAAVQKAGVEENKVTLDLRRRVNESLTQLRLRQLNEEYTAKAQNLEKELQAEVKAGADIISVRKKRLDEQQRLQMDYWDKMDALMARDRETQVQLAFDGSAFSVDAAKIKSEMDMVRLSFEQGAIGVDEFRLKISELSAQSEQLDLMRGAVTGLADAFSGLLVDSITDSENAMANFSKAMSNLGRNIVKELTAIGVRYLINQAIATSSMAATTATSSAMAKTVASAWATPAALVSAASYGANVAVGGAALAALLASTKVMAGFKDGGYTGDGGVDQVAGVVHGKEFVVNASGTSKNMSLLQMMNSGVDVAGVMNKRINTSVTPGTVSELKVILSPEVRLRGDDLRIGLSRADRRNNLFNGGL